MDASDGAGQEEPPASQARSRSEGGIGPEEEQNGVTEQGGRPRAGVLKTLEGYLAGPTSRLKVEFEFVERAARADLEWASTLA